MRRGKSEGYSRVKRYISHPLLKEGTIEERKYQISIARVAEKASTMVVLPTGLGKTTIALLVILKKLEEMGVGCNEECDVTSACEGSVVGADASIFSTTNLVVGASSSLPFILMRISVSSHSHTRTSVKQPAESRTPQPTEPFSSGFSLSQISKKPEMCDGAYALIFIN